MVVRELLAKIGFRVDDKGLRHADAELGKFKRTATDTDSATARLAGGVKGALVGLTGLAAVLSVGIGTKLFQVNAEFERLSAAMETVTGSAENAKRELAWIDTFAGETPYQLNQIIDGFIKLKARGMDPTEDTMRSLGNIASAMGKDLDQMIEAVADAVTGEFERLKEFGIKASSEGDRVSFTFQGVTTTVKKNAQEIEKYLLGIGNTEFAGAMQRQMDTLGGRLSNLIDWLSKTARAMGDAGLKDGAKKGLDALIDLVKGSKDAVVIIGKVLGGALKGVASVLQLVADNAKVVGVGLMLLTGGLVALSVKLGVASLAASGLNVQLALTYFWAAALPILVGALIVLWGLLIEDFIIWLEKGEESNTLIGEWQRQFPALGQVLEDVRILWNKLTDVVADFITIVATEGLWDPFITGLKNFGLETLEFFKNLFGWILLEIALFFINIGKSIGEKAADLWFPIEDAFQTTKARIEGFFTDLIDRIKKLIKEAIIAVVNLPSDVAEKMKNIPGLGKAFKVGGQLADFATGGVMGGKSGGAAKDVAGKVQQNTSRSSRRVDVGGMTLVQRDGESQQDFAARVREEIESLEESENRQADADLSPAYTY